MNKDLNLNDEGAERVKQLLRDIAYAMKLSKRVAKEIRQDQEFRKVEAARIRSTEESTVYIAA